jgi:hypothetical protein
MRAPASGFIRNGLRARRGWSVRAGSCARAIGLEIVGGIPESAFSSNGGTDETRTRPVEACWRFAAVFYATSYPAKPGEQTRTNVNDLDRETLICSNFPVGYCAHNGLVPGSVQAGPPAFAREARSCLESPRGEGGLGPRAQLGKPRRTEGRSVSRAKAKTD